MGSARVFFRKGSNGAFPRSREKASGSVASLDTVAGFDAILSMLPPRSVPVSDVARMPCDA